MGIVKIIWTKILLYSVFLIYPIAIFLIGSGFYLLITKQKPLADVVVIITGAITSISVVYLAEQIKTRK